MLLLPAQLHRQAPQRATAARPLQSVYQLTGWTSPSRGMTMVLARTTGGAATGRWAGGAACTASAAGAATAGAWFAATARASSAARSRSSCRTRRWSAASTWAMAAACAYTRWLEGVGCQVKSGKLKSQMAAPPTRGARQRRRRLAMGRATRTRRQGLRCLHDRHRAVRSPEFDPIYRFLTRSPSLARLWPRLTACIDFWEG